ncbi:MAG: alpha-N-acetylglucosaminidase [Prevotella sp.]|nr:alpha-N-acetylglucosaminidase [Prevotella sp.]
MKLPARPFATIILLLFLAVCPAGACPVCGLLERICEGSSAKFSFELTDDETGFFELGMSGDKVLVRGDNYVDIAAGVNWYLKHFCGVHLSWNGMTAALPDTLPEVLETQRYTTSLALRYDFNYCTFSYSMAFWDWPRWEREIDWMALHGINLPLAAVGMECVWRNMLLRQGYSRDETRQIIAGPAFLAWQAMGNLEGWGGPLSDEWFARQEALQKRILQRMREFGMQPVLPGYCGLLPHDASERLRVNVVPDAGLWNGFQRPATLSPDDARFAEIANIYYEEQAKLFGAADYYSTDPFHEAEAADVDFAAAGKAVLAAMRKANPKAVWVVQGWTENPREELLSALDTGDLLVLDLFSECRPMFGAPSIWRRDNGYGRHEWLFCLLENFGGNVGLHGRLDQLLRNFRLACSEPFSKHLRGIGLTMEGIENNAVMFELMCELPWLSNAELQGLTKEQWLLNYYIPARYGKFDERIAAAWNILATTIYNCPEGNNQQGTHESVFCARPSLHTFQASSWSKMENYYDPAATAEAARLFLSAADDFRGDNNYEFDLIDIVRQAVADRAREVYNSAVAAFKSNDEIGLFSRSDEFLRLLLLQDKLLGTRREFRVGNRTLQARNAGSNDDEKDLFEWNARVQITTWGGRDCADAGGLHDYAHKEWNGILRDLYYKRWAAFFDTLRTSPGTAPKPIDYYAMEAAWASDLTPYSAEPEGDCINTAREVFQSIFPE